MYSRVVLKTTTASPPAALPSDLLGLSNESLVDLTAALKPPPDDYRGIGYWPATIIDPPIDAAKQAFTDEFDLVADKKTKTVKATRRVRDLNAEELASVPFQILSRLAFINLVQSAGGMTDKMLVDAQADPVFAAFWIKYQMAGDVQHDDPITAASLDALAMGGYVPKGRDAVLSAWPKATA